MEKDLLLIAVPIFFGALAAIFLPNHRYVVAAIVSAAVIGACLGRIYGLPSEGAVEVCLVIVFVGTWVVAALLARLKMQAAIETTQKAVAALTTQTNMLQNALSETQVSMSLLDHNSLVSILEITRKEKDAVRAELVDLINRIRDTHGQEIKRLTEEAQARFGFVNHPPSGGTRS